jgi:hypothetical protein
MWLLSAWNVKTGVIEELIFYLNLILINPNLNTDATLLKEVEEDLRK